jgi:hypothetical protein
MYHSDTAIVKKEQPGKAKQFKKFWRMVTEPAKPAQQGKLYAFPIPLFSASPTVNFLYGIGATGSWFCGDPKDTRISNAQIGIAYTVKNQLITTFKSAIYLKHDDWILYGDWRFYLSSVPGFAPGTGPQTDVLASNGARFNDDPYANQASNVQLIYYDYLRLYETVLRHVIDKFYMGLAYHLDYYTQVQDKELNLSAPVPVTTNFYNYNIEHGFSQTGSVLSGVSVNAIYDSRDNQNNPYAGRFAYVSFKYNPTFFGSSQNSSTIWLEYRDYADITHNHYNILAFWVYGNFVTSGVMPYLSMPGSGSDQFGRSGEGYINARFKGEQVMFGEVEYRRHLFAIKNYPDFFGIAMFANMNTVGAKETNIKLFEYVDPAFGGGIRINISRVPRSNLGIDYAVGFYGSQGLYLRFNEAF